MAEVIRSKLITNGFTLQYVNSFPHPQLYGLSSNDFQRIVQESSGKARIYVVIGETNDAVSLLEALKDVGLLKTGETLLLCIYLSESGY